MVSLGIILTRFLNFCANFEPDDSYQKDSYKNNGVYSKFLVKISKVGWTVCTVFVNFSKTLMSKWLYDTSFESWALIWQNGEINHLGYLMEKLWEYGSLREAYSLFFYKKPRDPFGTQSFLKISQSSSQNFLRVS